jgi:hypothetical protein
MATRTMEQRPEIPSRFQPGLVVGVAASLLLAFIGYGIGTSRSSVVELTGRAAVGGHVASIESGGWWYGVNDSVAWIDASGSFHEDGWPACLRPEGTTRTVRFGAVPVTIPDSVGFRPVLWVDCRLS